LLCRRLGLLLAFVFLVAITPATVARADVGSCDNLALSGTASASSVYSSAYPASAVNNGVRNTSAGGHYWHDGTKNQWPDWVQVAWPSVRTIDRIAIRGVITVPGYPPGDSTLAQSRVQYWDTATSTWVDVAGGAGQANPILNWKMPESVSDGSEVKLFDFAPISTTKIRVLVEQGSTQGVSWLDEIEAYSLGGGCGVDPNNCQNKALSATASASSTHSAQYAPSAVNNGVRDTGYSQTFWNDGTPYAWPDWVQVAWPSAVDINRIIVRGDVTVPGYPAGVSTLGSARVQYWDTATSAWVDVTGGAGQANPILNWKMPEVLSDGSEAREFDFPVVSTTKVRVLIEDGSTDGQSWLEEIEAYKTDGCAAPTTGNLALTEWGGVASASSTHSAQYAPSAVNNGVRDTGYSQTFWNDGTPYVWPDWVQVAWPHVVTLNRLVIRGDVTVPGYPAGVSTLGKARVQIWNLTTETWDDVVGAAGQSNPIVNWKMPEVVSDGSEIKRFNFPDTPTTKVRVLIEDGSSDGQSWLEEIEAYGSGPRP
jgi:hypothetical protein